MRICLRQIMKVGDDKPKGNCSICIPDKYNKDCEGYIPFNLVEVKMATKLDEKTENRIKIMSEWLQLSFCDTEKALIEIGLSNLEKGMNNANKNKEMQLLSENIYELEESRSTNG